MKRYDLMKLKFTVNGVTRQLTNRDPGGKSPRIFVSISGVHLLFCLLLAEHIAQRDGIPIYDAVRNIHRTKVTSCDYVCAGVSRGHLMSKSFSGITWINHSSLLLRSYGSEKFPFAVDFALRVHPGFFTTNLYGSIDIEKIKGEYVWSIVG